MALALVYDPRFHTFESWASLMCEAYAGQQLMTPTKDTNWQEWGAGLKAIDLFENNAIPGPYVFNDWQEWAQALVNIINQPVN